MKSIAIVATSGLALLAGIVWLNAATFTSESVQVQILREEQAQSRSLERIAKALEQLANKR